MSRKQAAKKLYFWQVALSKCPNCKVKVKNWKVWGLYEYINAKKLKVSNVCNNCVGSEMFQSFMRQLGGRPIEFEVHAYLMANDPILAKLTEIEKGLRGPTEGEMIEEADIAEGGM
jgi:hypothetical protein